MADLPIGAVKATTITPYVPTEAVRTCCYWNDHDGCLCKEPEEDCPVEKEVQP